MTDEEPRKVDYDTPLSAPIIFQLINSSIQSGKPLYLVRANLRGAVLYQASLGGANLRLADLSRAILSEADLGRADLTDANLSGSQ